MLKEAGFAAPGRRPHGLLKVKGEKICPLNGAFTSRKNKTKLKPPKRSAEANPASLDQLGPGKGTNQSWSAERAKNFLGSDAFYQESWQLPLFPSNLCQKKKKKEITILVGPSMQNTSKRKHEKKKKKACQKRWFFSFLFFWNLFFLSFPILYLFQKYSVQLN